MGDEKINHGYTSHGHPCCGSAPIGGWLKAVARCGGLILCPVCHADAYLIHRGPREWSIQPEPGPEVTRLTTPADDEVIIQRGPCPTGVHRSECWTITRGPTARWKRCETWPWILAEYGRLVDASLKRGAQQ